MTARLTNYGTCNSSDDYNEEDEFGVTGGFKTMNEKKRELKNKGRRSDTPPKETFFKKPNIASQ